MKNNKSAASDLFLLMLNLSQMTAKDKIIEVFIEALKEIWVDFRIQFTELAPSSDTNLIEISTAGNTYGWLQVENISKMSNEAESLLNNACGMLAVILRKTEQDILLADDKLRLQKLVDQHINELTDSYEELKREAVIRKQAKVKLQKSELQYRNQASFLNVVIENSPFAMWVSDAEGVMIRANQALRNILNVTDAMIIGKYNILHDENLTAQGLLPDVEAVFKELQSARFTMFWEGSKAGDVDLSIANDIWIDVSLFPIQDEAGKLVNVVCQYLDITERKQAEEALRKSEERFRITQEVSPDGFTILRPVRDVQGQIVDFTWVYENATIARLNGTDPKAVIGERLLEMFPGHAGTQFLKAYKLVAETGEHCIFESEYCGETITTPTSFRIVVVPTGSDIAILTQDITERKQVEEALKQSEHNYRMLFDNMSEGIFVLDAETQKVVLSNKAIAQIYGFDSEADTNDLNPIDFVLPEDKEAVYKIIAEDMFKNDLRQINEFRSLTKDGREIWISAVGVRTDYKGRLAGLISVQEITKRKKVEEELKASSLATEASINAIFASDLKGIITYANTSASKMWGYKCTEEMIGTNAIEYWTESTQGKAEEMIGTLLKEGNVATSEVLIGKRLDGTEFIVESNSVIMKDENGKPLGLIGSFSDITERKQAEEAIQRSEKRLRTILDTSPFPTAVVDISDENILYWSKSAIQLFGYNPKTVKEWYELAYPDPEYRQEVIKRWKPFLEKAQDSVEALNTGERSIVCKDGSLKICDLYVQFIPGNIIVTLNDITERKQAEQKLIESLSRSELLFEHAAIPIWEEDFSEVKKYIDNLRNAGIVDLESYLYDRIDEVQKLASLVSIRRVNKKNLEFYEVNDLSELSRNLPDWFSEESLHVFRDEIVSLANGAEKYENEILVHKPNGESKYLLLNLSILPDNREPWDRIFVSFIDITDRKIAEEALEKSEEYFRTLIENSSDVISILDEKGIITYESPSQEKVLGYETGQLIGENVFGLVHPDDRERISLQFVKLLKRSNGIEQVNFRFLHKDGTWIYIEGTGTNLLNSSKIKGIVVNYRDITDRKQVEEVLHQKMSDLEIFNDAAVDREIAINDLRKEINELLVKLGKEEKYEIVE